MKINLPDYKKIASEIKKREAEVTKEEIENLKLKKERMERLRVRQEILEKIAKATQVEIPGILIEREQKRMLEDLKKQVPQILQINFEDYLVKINKTEKELTDSLLAEAQRRIKNSLILKEIGAREGIEVSNQEVEGEANKISKENPDLRTLDQERLREYIEGVIKTEKTLQFLENFTK